MKQLLQKKLGYGLLLLLLTASFAHAQKFVNPLPIPYEVHDFTHDGFDTILLRVDSFQHNFNPNGAMVGDELDHLNVDVTTMAFNQQDSTGSSALTYLGPSIAWKFGDSVHTEVANNLEYSTTCHWHGAHVPSYCDGNPHQKIAPGFANRWMIDFEIDDKSATMWYHPHVMDHTYEQVQMGMSGMIYVEDPPGGDDDSILVALHNLLPHDYDINDFPLIVQSKRFYRDSTQGDRVRIDSFCCGSTGSSGAGAPGSYKDNYQYIVNGNMVPFLEVPQQVVRLRILNGDAKFSFNFGLGDESYAATPFYLIATDAGYTDSTYDLNSVLMAPGERTEWLVDLRTKSVGDTLFLMNFGSGIPSNVIGGLNSYGQKDTALLKFIVVAPDTAGKDSIATFPFALHPLEVPPVFSYTKKRTKTFTGAGNSGDPFLIDNRAMSSTYINDVVLLDSTEEWTIVNNTGKAHPWHIHDIHFWVTSVKDFSGTEIDHDAWPNIFNGPLDNVLVLSGWTLKYVTVFDDFGTDIRYDSSYMFHCHILPHEDVGMMGQFVVWDSARFPNAVRVEDFVFTDGSMLLFPNPATNELYLEGKSRRESNVRIIDVQGRVLKTQKLSAFDGNSQINIDGLGRGIFFVEWTTKKGVFTRKVMLE